MLGTRSTRGNWGKSSWLAAAPGLALDDLLDQEAVELELLDDVLDMIRDILCLGFVQFLDDLVIDILVYGGRSVTGKVDSGFGGIFALHGVGWVGIPSTSLRVNFSSHNASSFTNLALSELGKPKWVGWESNPRHFA